MQSLVYQFGVLPSKWIQGEELTRRAKNMWRPGQSVPSCAGRGWAAATGHGMIGGHLAGGTPVLPWHTRLDCPGTVALYQEIEIVEKSWNCNLPVQLTWSIYGAGLVERPQKMLRHGRTAPSCARRELHVATGPGTMTRHPTCTSGTSVWPWPMEPAHTATRTPCPAPGTVPAMMMRKGAMLPSSSTLNSASCTGSWLCMKKIQSAWSTNSCPCQNARLMTCRLISLSQSMVYKWALWEARSQKGWEMCRFMLVPPTILQRRPSMTIWYGSQ